jgi:pyrroloquinoline quinone (PQQ) biosynthesis protein C
MGTLGLRCGAFVVGAVVGRATLQEERAWVQTRLDSEESALARFQGFAMTELATQEAELLSLYDEFPFEFHPFWQAVLDRSLTLPQVLLAEVQHYVRTRAGRSLRERAVVESKSMDPRIFQVLLRTYLEECTDTGGPSHLDLIERLLVDGGMSKDTLSSAAPTPGNSAAIALYKDISARGAGCHLVGAGIVEHYYSQLCPRIFATYVDGYGMTPIQAETYRIHGPMDAEHARRALAVLGTAIDLHGYDAIRLSVRDAFVATSLHYDGMLQAALGTRTYWDGMR